MIEDYLRILKIIDTVGELKSRKKIQKIVYLLQQKGLPFNENFSLHHYGPYSPELQIEIDRLTDGGLIKQESIDDSYVFQIEEKGTSFLRDKELLIQQLTINKVPDLIEDLNSIEPSYILEMMATIVYFEKSYGKNKDRLKEVLGEVKPKLISHFDKAWENLDKLNLHSGKR